MNRLKRLMDADIRNRRSMKSTATAETNDSPWRSLLAGAAAGAFSKTVTAPIERVKLLLQLRDRETSCNIRQVVHQVYQEEGMLGFWRGNMPSVLQKMGNSALNFYLMDYYKLTISKLLTTLWNKNGNDTATTRSLQIVNSFLSGGLSGATTTTILYPLEFLRTRLAVDIANKSKGGATRQFQGMSDVLVYTFSQDGVWGMYKGYAPSIAYVAMHRVFYLGGFDVYKTATLDYTHQTSLNMMQRVGIAQSVSLLAATVCYPLDTVRRQLMMQAGKEEKQFTNVWNCTIHVYKRDGIQGFFRGLGANLAKTVGGALLLVAYDYFRNVM